jgi:hypothetical protein
MSQRATHGGKKHFMNQHEAIRDEASEYEAPRITQLGSIADFTSANRFGRRMDGRRVYNGGS